MISVLRNKAFIQYVPITREGIDCGSLIGWWQFPLTFDHKSPSLVDEASAFLGNLLQLWSDKRLCTNADKGLFAYHVSQFWGFLDHPII